MLTIEIDCVKFCKVLADETRQGILQLLQDRNEACVSEIVEAFGASQPTISHHLRLLRNAGLVVARRQGKQVYYALNQDNVTECCGVLMAKFVPSFAVETPEEAVQPG